MKVFPDFEVENPTNNHCHHVLQPISEATVGLLKWASKLHNNFRAQFVCKSCAIRDLWEENCWHGATKLQLHATNIKIYRGKYIIMLCVTQ